MPSSMTLIKFENGRWYLMPVLFFCNGVEYITAPFVIQNSLFCLSHLNSSLFKPNQAALSQNLSQVSAHNHWRHTTPRAQVRISPTPNPTSILLHPCALVFLIHWAFYKPSTPDKASTPHYTSLFSVTTLYIKHLILRSISWGRNRRPTPVLELK